MEKDFDFNELEQILKKVREEQQQNREEYNAPAVEELEPPKTAEELKAQAEEVNEPAPQPEPISPPAPTKEEKAPVKKEKAPKKKREMPKLKLNTKVISANVKTRLVPKVKEFFKKELTRKALISVGCIIALVGLVFGGIKVVQFAQVAYLRPYIEKYGIDFPKGIREEFCDDYGKDQGVMGRIVIEDTATDALAGSNKKADAYAEKGSTVLKDQQVRAVALSSGELEKCYSTAEAYVNSSQLVTFRTLFDDEQYKVVAAYYANTNPDNDNGYVFPYNAYGNMTEKSFDSYIDRVNTRSLYITDNELNYDGTYLSISVPTETEPDSRFVILCKKVGDKEKFKKTTKTTPNERIRKTQAWYDEHNEKNPFWLASKWYPEIYTDEAKTKIKQLTAEDFE